MSALPSLYSIGQDYIIATVLCISESTCILCSGSTLDFPPVEKPFQGTQSSQPLLGTPLALVMLTDCTQLFCFLLYSIVFHCNTQCAIKLHCSAHRKGWLVCAGNPLCLAIKQIGSLPRNTILFSQCNKKFCSASATENHTQ